MLDANGEWYSNRKQILPPEGEGPQYKAAKGMDNLALFNLRRMNEDYHEGLESVSHFLRIDGVLHCHQ